MSPVNASSFGRKGAFVRRWPGGTEKASILRTVLRWMPKRRAASRWLSPSTWQAWRTLPYSSTENIPRLPARSDRAQGRHQGGTVWHRRGRDTQPAVSEGHFLTAAYTIGSSLAPEDGQSTLRRGRDLAVAQRCRFRQRSLSPSVR